MSSRAGRYVTEALEYDGRRQVTVYIPPDPPEVLVFAADGGWHISRLGEAIEASSAPSTMIVGVHGRDDEEARLQEYSPEFDADRFEAHQEFFVHDVRQWVQTRFGVALPSERTALWGASAGAELALTVGLRYPDVFGSVFSASPGGLEPPTQMPNPLPRVYLVAGSEEPWFLENATRWADALRDAGADTVMMKRPGEHGGTFWFEEFPLMVLWALKR